MNVRKDEDKLVVEPERKNPITNCVMFQTVVDWLKDISLEFQEYLKTLDYYQTSTYREQELIQYGNAMDIHAHVNPGGSEGVYLDWYWTTGKPNDKPIDIGTFKTLDEGIHAYEIMGAIAGLLTFGSWRFINRNWDQITKK